MSGRASRAEGVLRTLFVVGERDGVDVAVAQFDRWLAEVVRAAKYEAWQEGHTHCFHVGDPNQDERNPYRKEGNDEHES